MYIVKRVKLILRVSIFVCSQLPEVTYTGKVPFARNATVLTFYF